MRAGTYRHYKGKFYQVIGVAKHSETLEDLVVYFCLYPNNLSQIWVRPKKMFGGQVIVDGKQVKRFTYIRETSAVHSS